MAKELQSTLEGLRIAVFLDKKDIAWGDDVLERVARGLADSSAVIVIVSPASLKSQWVAFEVGHAMALGKKVLPFLSHRSIEVPDFLRKLNHKSKIEDVRAFFSEQLAAAHLVSSSSSGSTSPKERDGVRAARNELLETRMRSESGVKSATVLQLDGHTDNGYILYVEFDDTKASAGKLLERVRELFAELFPDVAVWGEMKVEEDTSMGFAFTYLDKWNRRIWTG